MDLPKWFDGEVPKKATADVFFGSPGSVAYAQSSSPARDGHFPTGSLKSGEEPPARDGHRLSALSVYLLNKFSSTLAPRPAYPFPMPCHLRAVGSKHNAPFTEFTDYCWNADCPMPGNIVKSLLPAYCQALFRSNFFK